MLSQIYMKIFTDFNRHPFKTWKIWKLKFFVKFSVLFQNFAFSPLIYINFQSSIKVMTSLILYQNFCSQKNIKMFLRTVREPSEFGQALVKFESSLGQVWFPVDITSIFGRNRVRFGSKTIHSTIVPHNYLHNWSETKGILIYFLE